MMFIGYRNSNRFIGDLRRREFVYGSWFIKIIFMISFFLLLFLVFIFRNTYLEILGGVFFLFFGILG